MNTHQNQPTATRGAAVGVVVYLLLSSSKLIGAYLFQSVSLHADGLNNLSDIVGSLFIFIGLTIANKPADENHHFGHSKFEAIASFITSVLMFTIGLNVLTSSVQRLVTQHYDNTDIKASYVAIISMMILWFTSRYIKNLAKKTKSLGLKTTSTDMFNDFLISSGTLVGTIFVQFGLPIIDVIISFIVSIIIIQSAFEIFKESTFLLSDGFDREELEKYCTLILKHPRVMDVSNIRGRISGNNVYIDVTIKINAQLSVFESHNITEDIERILSYNYNVHDCDVHVEPYYPEQS